jgi:hypothetical protein
MKKLIALVTGLHLMGAALAHADYHTNVITTPTEEYAFSVDGSAPTNPTIELVAGVTNILDIQTADIHPVVIANTPDGSDGYSDARPQIVNSEPITVLTPTTGFPDTLYYICYYHGFYGEIHFSMPAGTPNPPPNTILEIHVGTNVVMTSTGTSTTWLLVPEFSSNLFHGAWADVPGYTNFFANGTNTTIFPRLDPICGPNVFLRTRFQQP